MCQVGHKTLPTHLVPCQNFTVYFFVLNVHDDDDDDDDDRAAEFELRQLKLSVDGQLRSRDDNVKQLQKQVTITLLLTY